MARDCARQRAYWKHVKLARQLLAENLAAYNAQLKEARTVVSHPENSGCLDLPVPPIVSESNIYLTIKSRTINTAQMQSDLHELYAEEAKSEDSDELEFRKCLFNQPYEPHSYIDTLSICCNCMKQEETFPRRFARYCSKNCHVKDWPSHKQMHKAFQTLPCLEDYSGGL